ncbi:cytochrome b561 [Silvimonas terrae]|uniref:Cytochrome b561 n=1 Tax=Silvimonas terrae TaxID=300266 RepID=A0A840RDD6_9NEIS|nr:cytochrome b/b6 domain-containing protein [Silvimonas terrae]MBB5190987.1 cytochrome b561 [Silvimonas terrae]
MKEAIYFARPLRWLHWLMAPLMVLMLFIGVFMVSTVSTWHNRLVGVHKPLGMALLVLVVVRLVVRWLNTTPRLPSTLPRWQQALAHGSHWLLYGLMLLMPLIGWGMQSAAGYPVVLGGWVLPALVPHDVALYATLCMAHGLLALVLFATVVAHLAAALFHGLVRRDGVLQSMTGQARRGRS